MATKIIDPNDIVQAEAACQSISNIAEAIQRLAALVIDDDGDDFDVNKVVAIRELAGQAGWLSDLAGRKLGVPGYRGDAEAWMLSSVVHRESKEASHG